MNSAGNQRELIRQIKEAREHCGISYQKIVDRVLESGGSISLSSVRKVFREDAEELHFRTEDTLLPIARVLLPPGSLSGERENAPCQSERVPDEGIQSEYARERQKEEEREERRQPAVFRICVPLQKFLRKTRTRKVYSIFPVFSSVERSFFP